MPRSISFTFPDGKLANVAPGVLRAQPLNNAGAVVGALITTGFGRANNVANWFVWTGDVPDGFTGSIQILTSDGRSLGSYPVAPPREEAASAEDVAAEVAAELERAGGPLANVATVAGKLATMLVSAGAGLLSRFTAPALQNAPLGDGSTGENLAALNGTIGALQVSMNRIASLVGENQVSRDFVYDSAGTIQSFTIRSYDTAANAESDDGENGLLGEYSVTNTLNADGLVEATSTTLNT